MFALWLSPSCPTMQNNVTTPEGSRGSSWWYSRALTLLCSTTRSDDTRCGSIRADSGSATVWWCANSPLGALAPALEESVLVYNTWYTMIGAQWLMHNTWCMMIGAQWFFHNAWLRKLSEHTLSITRQAASTKWCAPNSRHTTRSFRDDYRNTFSCPRAARIDTWELPICWVTADGGYRCC